MSSIVEDLLTARSRDQRPSAPGANLRDADLRHVDLCNADLQSANLQNASLRGANLWGADLSSASLGDADLQGAYLQGANLRNAYLGGANLLGVSLLGANLWGPRLRCHGIVALGETPSGGSLIFPTPAGWVMQVGCWRGSPYNLRDLISSDEDWPEARGHEVAYRRPYLELVLAHADLVMAEHDGLIEQLAAKWGTK